jgi:signal transduction histidine kinase
MIENLLADPLAAFFGVVGMVCLMSWPLFRSRTGMLAAQLGIAVGLGLHYWLLGVRTAAVMQALSFAQIVAAIPLARRPGLRVLYLALVPVIAAAAALTWQGLPSFFSSAALSLITLARMQRDPRRLRILMLVAGPFWMTHDWMVGSLPAFSADLVSFSVGLWKLRDEGRGRTGAAPAD